MTEKKKISVIGAGPWGSTLALLLHDNGHKVSLWAYNSMLTPGFELPKEVRVSSSISEVIDDSESIVIATNSSHLIQTVSQFPRLDPETRILLATKGFVELEKENLLPFQAVQKITSLPEGNFAVLSGANIASEIKEKKLSGTTIASKNAETSRYFADLFHNTRYFRVWTSHDIIGASLGGILKNVYAIILSMCRCLYPGCSNTYAMLITRCMKEMQRFIKAYGADPDSVISNAILADLIATSESGRNAKVGEMLCEGMSLDDIYDKFSPQIPEGPNTVKLLYNIAKEKDIDMSILDEIYGIIFNNQSPKEVACSLMGCDHKKEHY